MKKTLSESHMDYYHKMSEIYDHVLKCEKRNEPITRGLLEDYLRTCSSPNGGKKGCATDAITIMKNDNILHITNRKFYALKVRNIDDMIKEAALKMAEKKRKPNESKAKKHDVVQPTLFTESVMREQEQPIVTATDQLRQRIAEMELKLDRSTMAFCTDMADYAVSLSRLEQKYDKQRIGLIEFIETSHNALNRLLQSL